jgi:AcrR family transcriptional regulator
MGSDPDPPTPPSQVSPEEAPDTIPEPPWRAPARGREEHRAPLTRQAIVDAALRVLDREGMDGLSMRKVGEELGTGAASLYWHVRNKDELLQLLFERVTEEVVLSPPDPTRWKEQLKDLGRQSRQVMKRYRDIARVSLGRIPVGRTMALLSEWLFELLRPVGIPDQVIAYVGDLMGLYVGAYAFEESLGLSSPTGEELPPHEVIAMMKDYILSLPPERFPHTLSAVDALFSGGPDERFEFGMDVIVRGLESYAQPSERTAR